VERNNRRVAPRSVLGRKVTWVTGKTTGSSSFCVDGFDTKLEEAARLDLGLTRYRHGRRVPRLVDEGLAVGAAGTATVHAGDGPPGAALG